VSGGSVTASSHLVAAWLERQLLNLANSPYRSRANSQRAKNQTFTYTYLTGVVQQLLPLLETSRLQLLLSFQTQATPIHSDGKPHDH
jgi:hypothetical protein